MGNMNALGLGVVKAFRGHSVKLGVVQVSDGEFVEHLDDTYADAIICNVSYGAGAVLYSADIARFQSLKDEYQEELQNELKSQMRQGNDVDIDWHE
jgi:spore coat protein CotH